MNFEFPIPPSVNTYWGFHGHRRFLTAKANAFKNAVLVQAKKISMNTLAGRLRVDVTLHFPDRRMRDIDNHIKSLLDAITQAGVWEDDSQIDELIIRRGEIVKGGKCYVSVIDV